MGDCLIIKDMQSLDCLPEPEQIREEKFPSYRKSPRAEAPRARRGIWLESIPPCLRLGFCHGLTKRPRFSPCRGLFSPPRVGILLRRYPSVPWERLEPPGDGAEKSQEKVCVCVEWVSETVNLPFFMESWNCLG